MPKDMVGKNAKLSILQNVTAEDMVHRGVLDTQFMQLDTQANCILALDFGHVDAAAVDDSTCCWPYAPNSTKYKIGNQAWDSQTYSAPARPRDPRWLKAALHVRRKPNQPLTGSLTVLDSTKCDRCSDA